MQVISIRWAEGRGTPELCVERLSEVLRTKRELIDERELDTHVRWADGFVLRLQRKRGLSLWVTGWNEPPPPKTSGGFIVEKN
jgi:hypothetical protein